MRNNLNFLSLLSNAEDEQKVVLLKSMNSEQFKVLLECIYNVLYGTISLSPKNKKKLSQYKDIIRRIIAEDTTRSQRRRLLLKYRSVLLPTLLKTVLSQIKS